LSQIQIVIHTVNIQYSLTNNHIFSLIQKYNTFIYTLIYILIMPGPKELAIALYTKELEKLNYTVDADLLNTVVNRLGVAAYDSTSDAAVVAGKDKEERDRVIANLFVKRLGIDSEEKANTLLDAAIAKYGSSNPRKYRVVLYYIVIVDNKMKETFIA
jgi:hypothetical protein